MTYLDILTLGKNSFVNQISLTEKVFLSRYERLPESLVKEKVSLYEHNA